MIVKNKYLQNNLLYIAKITFSMKTQKHLLKYFLFCWISLFGFIKLSTAAECDPLDNSNNENGCLVSTNNLSYDLIGDITLVNIPDYAITFDSANGNTITNTGDMLVPAAIIGGNAINFADSNNNTFTQIGNIINLSAPGGRGINLENSDSNTISMVGNISTKGFAIYSDSNSDNNIINYDGIISLNTNFYDGARISGESNTVSLSGQINTSEDVMAGVRIYGDSNSVVINSDMNLNGFLNKGLYVAADSNEITINGDVVISGAGGTGIHIASGNNNTIHVNGNILIDSSTYAVNIDGVSRNNTVVIGNGAIITGILQDGGTNSSLQFNHGAGKSYAYSTVGSWNITDLNNRPMVEGSAYAMGIGSIETAGHELYQRNFQLNQSINDRLLAYHTNTAAPYWMNTYYGHNGRGNNTNLSSNNQQFSNHRSGVNLGYRIDKWEQPIEVLFNYEANNMNHDNFSHKVDSDSFMLGLLLPNAYTLHNGHLSFKTLAGMSDNRGDRTVLTNDANYNGVRNIKSDFSTKYFTVGAEWLKTLFQNETINLHALVGLDINNQFTESYNEDAYFKIDSRNLTQLESKILLMGRMQPFAAYPFEIMANVGIENRNLISGKQQKYQINNTDVNYTHSNTYNTYYTAGLGINYKIKPTIDAYVDLKTFDSADNIYYSSGSVGIRGSF